MRLLHGARSSGTQHARVRQLSRGVSQIRTHTQTQARTPNTTPSTSHLASLSSTSSAISSKSSKSSQPSTSSKSINASTPKYSYATHANPQPNLKDLMQTYNSLPPRLTPLSTLLSFGAPLTPSSLVLSASYVLEELPRRLAQRVNAMESLPFIVGMNPYISRVLNSYRQSFQDLATAPAVTDVQSNLQFTRGLEELVRNHSNDIPVLARGFQESAKYMRRPEDVAAFLDGAIRSRIAIRFIAEQHIALTRALKPASNVGHSRGVIDSECSPLEMINMCKAFVHELSMGTFGVAPEVVIEGMKDVTFPYVPVHIEYVLTEILKNSYRATVEHHQRQTQRGRKELPIPPIQITISLATLPIPPTPPAPFILNQPNQPYPAHYPSQVQMQDSGAPIETQPPRPPPSYLSIRVRDQGGGVNPRDLQRIFSYAFTTARGVRETEDEAGGGGPYAMQAIGGLAGMAEQEDFGTMGMSGGVEDSMGGGGKDAGNLFGEIVGKGLQTGLGTIAGLGYGLPMARLYTSYFGGSLELMSMHGHGTDVFIKFRCLDESSNIEV